jgi:hypothetical protein
MKSARRNFRRSRRSGTDVHRPTLGRNGSEEDGGHGWKIRMWAASVSDFAKAAKVGQSPSDPMHTLNARSLHSTDHRFAMICSGRDDRVESG